MALLALGKTATFRHFFLARSGRRPVWGPGTEGQLTLGSEGQAMLCGKGQASWRGAPT
jgi:hypothetical protein